MRRFPYYLFILSTIISCNNIEDYTLYVDPCIGTAHCRWFHFTPGSLPFGMAKPAPSTNGHLGNKWGWEATGYDYRDSTIAGFPCFHEFQIGGVSLMPTSGELITRPGLPNQVKDPFGYQSYFSHDKEIANPGYYSVFLERYGIQVELTATKRVALQKYHYPKGRSNIIFDIGHRQGESGVVKDAYVTYTDDDCIEGWVVTEPEYVKKYQSGASISMYFSAKVDAKPGEIGCFNDSITMPGVKTISGIGSGLYMTFDFDSPTNVTAKIGLSYTSIENARLNLLAEAENIDFEKAVTQSHDIWQEHLSRIAIKSDVHSDKVKFYTGLYHAILGRGIATDCNGCYSAHDGSIKKVPLDNAGLPKFDMYNTDADWGAQWNLTQLWALAYPEYYAGHVSSHLQVYEDSGWLGDGLACGRYVSGVGTNLLSAILAAAYQCGICGWDDDLGYKAALKNELEGDARPLGAGKVDTRQFVEYGYVPHKDFGEGPAESYQFSASHTLEASYSAWALAQWADKRSDKANYDKLMWLSNGWKRLYDSTINFVRPKDVDGKFIDKFDPMEVWRGFQEGNAWQYTFYVPHDSKTLIEMMGKNEFNCRLDSIFTLSQKMIFSGGKEVGAFAGLKTLYNHGNQPCLHIPWLFNESGRPSLTQKWVRAILNDFYGVDGIHGYGYGQDEDQGQLGAWYVMSSIGLFDIKGLTDVDPSYALGSPLFDEISIRLPNGKYFDIQVKETKPNDRCKKIYIQSVTLNGDKLSTLRIPFATILRGGVLIFEMGDAPVDNY